MAVPSLPYTVIKRDQDIEIREYETFQIIETSTSDDFNSLFNYIQGANAKQEKISMTSPVINRYTSGNVGNMSFVILQDDIPHPTNQMLSQKTIEKARFATIRFSGTINQNTMMKEKMKLIDWLQKEQIPFEATTFVARYNSPFMPFFLRRNELWIKLK